MLVEHFVPAAQLDFGRETLLPGEVVCYGSDDTVDSAFVRIAPSVS